jgi:hypothetical protein
LASPPTDTACDEDNELAFPLPPSCTVALPPPAVGSPEVDWSPDAVEVAVGGDVLVAVEVDAPPVAVEVAVPVAVPPLPAELVLEFEPAPPAPPFRFADTVLAAELVCVNVLVLVLVLLPEFVAVEAFGWLVAPCVLVLLVWTSSPSAAATNASARSATPASKVVRILLT